MRDIGRKLLMWAAIALVIFFVAFRPHIAANVLGTLGNVAVDILTGVGDFFKRLVGGTFN